MELHVARTLEFDDAVDSVEEMRAQKHSVLGALAFVDVTGEDAFSLQLPQIHEDAVGGDVAAIPGRGDVA